MRRTATLPPTLEDIEQLAQRAIETLPELFRDHLHRVLLRVEDFPSEEVVEAMELESEFDILGLYQGLSMLHRGDEPTGAMPDMIFLYRRPILDHWAESADSLEAIVTHVLIHEVGHHFGFSDEDMERIEAAAAAQEDARA